MKFRLVALPAALLLIALAIFTSCEDEFSEKDAFDQALAYSLKKDSIARAEKLAQAKKDSIEKAREINKDSVIVNVRVLSYPSNAVLPGVTVQAYQTSSFSTVTNVDGLAQFKILRGNSELSLAAADHASARFQYGYNTTQGQPVVFLTVRLPRVKTDGVLTIQGNAYAELDLTSTQLNAVVPSGVAVKASLTTDFIPGINYLNDPLITNIVVSDFPTLSAETVTDGTGTYTLSLPAVTGITYSYRVDFSDFTATQKLAINRFTDANEMPYQRNLFGDFNLAEVATQFQARDLGAVSSALTAIPFNVPVFKVEVLTDPIAGTKPLYTAAVVSTPNESFSFGLPIGRIYSLTKLSYGNENYSSNTTILFKITDLRNGTTAEVSYNNNYYGGSLPTTIQMSPNNYYYYNYAPSPGVTFLPGRNSYESVVTPNGYFYPSNPITMTNSYGSNSLFFARNPRSFGIVPNSFGSFPGALYFDHLKQRFYIIVNGTAGSSINLNVTYGTGVRTRPVE